MYLHWSNRRHLDQVKARFAPDYYFGSSLIMLLVNDFLDNAVMLQLRRL
jgi:hypothetical protein